MVLVSVDLSITWFSSFKLHGQPSGASKPIPWVLDSKTTAQHFHGDTELSLGRCH